MTKRSHRAPGEGRTYQVHEVSRVAGVSVRALHHYDAIGLLPARRSRADYRVYHEEDLLRLQQILIGRALGMPLEAIRRSLDEPGFDRRAALERQRAELSERAERTAGMLRAIDRALAAMNQGVTMNDTNETDLTALFEGFDPDPYQDEAKARWGEHASYQESARRTATYTKADWDAYRAEAEAIMRDAAGCFGSGAPWSSDAAMDVAERHRRSIDRWFYPCDRSMHASLADLYEADPRFQANIDKYADGLTGWWSAAVRANAAR